MPRRTYHSGLRIFDRAMRCRALLGIARDSGVFKHRWAIFRPLEDCAFRLHPF
jgi:hypothetical protein